MLPAYQALPAIYDISPTEDGWTCTLDAIVEAVGARGALLFGIDETDVDYSVEKASTFWHDKVHLLPEFMQRFGDYDAYGRNVLFRSPRHGLITDYEIWPDEDLRAREDFVFMREKTGTFLRMGVNLSPDHGWKAGVILHFPDRLRTVGRPAHDRVAFLAPHLARSLELRRFVSRLVARYRLVLSVLDRVRVGICVADRAGEVVVANEEARRILDKAENLRLDRNGRLLARDPDTSAAISAALQRAAQTARELDRNSGAAMHVPHSAGKEPIYLEISPVRDTEGELSAGFAGAFVTLIDPNDPPDLLPGPLTVLCGLTSAEHEVSALLLKGNPIDRIAEVRGVSPETIKTQSRAVYRKARVASRGELVRKLAHLNPPIG